MRCVLSGIGILSISAFVACGGGDSTGDDPSGPATESTSETAPAPPPSVPTATTPAAPPAAPAPKPVRFIAMGDTGTGSTDQIKVGNQVAAKCKKDGCDFVQLLGDNIYDSGVSSTSDPQWQEKFEIPYAAVELDFFAVLGNHDYGHGGAGTDFPKGKHEIDYTQVSKKWKMPAASYHFTKGEPGSSVEMIALDTNKALFGQDEDQRQNVPGWISAATATWKIAVGHHPYLSNGPHGNAGKYDGIPIPPVSGKNVKSLLEDVICGKVDLYLSGHDHSRQWLNASCKGTELAVSGAGAKATELKGSNPVLFESLELGFLYIVIEGKKLTAEFVDENGVVEFTHVIKKP